MPIYNQDIIINKLNRYLHLNNRNIKLKLGHCHGFTLLWLYKMMHGDEEWFYDTLKKIAHCRSKEDFAKIEVDIEKMIANIVWLQDPENYDHEIHQLDVDKSLDLPRELSLSFLFNNQQLNETLSTVLLHENKMICLSGPNHTIGVFRKNGHNYIFDPNYNQGKAKMISEVGTLKNEIIRCLFRNKKLVGRKLPIEINITTEAVDMDTNIDKMEIYDGLLDGAASNLDKPGYDGITNLYLACESGDYEEVEALLKKGADANQFSKDSWTPLLIAAEKGYTIICELLLRNKAIIDKTDKDGDTPLHLAVNGGHEETVKLLLEAGAKPVKTKKFTTPLHNALAHKEWNMIAMMLAHVDNYADIGSRDRNGLRIHRLEIKAAAKQLRPEMNTSNRKRLDALINELDQASHRENLFHTKIDRRKPKRILHHKQASPYHLRAGIHK